MSRGKGPRAGGRKEKAKPINLKDVKNLVPKLARNIRKNVAEAPTLEPPVGVAPAGIVPGERPAPPPLPTVVNPRPAEPSVISPPGGSSSGTRSDQPGSIVNNNNYSFDPHFHFDPTLNVGISANFNPSIFGLGGGGGGGTRGSIGWNWDGGTTVDPALIGDVGESGTGNWDMDIDSPEAPTGPVITELDDNTENEVALDDFINGANGGTWGAVIDAIDAVVRRGVGVDASTNTPGVGTSDASTNTRLPRGRGNPPGRDATTNTPGVGTSDASTNTRLPRGRGNPSDAATSTEVVARRNAGTNTVDLSDSRKVSGKRKRADDDDRPDEPKKAKDHGSYVAPPKLPKEKKKPRKKEEKKTEEEKKEEKEYKYTTWRKPEPHDKKSAKRKRADNDDRQGWRKMFRIGVEGNKGFYQQIKALERKLRKDKDPADDPLLNVLSDYLKKVLPDSKRPTTLKRKMIDIEKEDDNVKSMMKMIEKAAARKKEKWVAARKKAAAKKK